MTGCALRRGQLSRQCSARSISSEPCDERPALVRDVPELDERLAAVIIPTHKELYQRHIEATGEEIDALVYELYGLTEEEIAIVEDAQQ